MKTVDYFFGMFDMNHFIIMIESLQFRLKDFIYKIKRIHRLKQFIFFSGLYLSDIRFRCIEQHSLLKLRRPYHLHLDKVLSPAFILAANIDNAILPQWVFRNQLGRKILDLHDLFIRL